MPHLTRPSFRLIIPCAVLLAFLPAAYEAGAVPVISEFLASNSRTLEDEDIDEPDWIEVHNTGSAAVNLAGYYLTSDPANLTEWQFPAVTLEANAYLVVFASGKDRAPVDGPLHTSFRLPADGGMVALVMPDGATVASQFADYPPQVTDVSFGSNAAQVTGFFAEPSPGAANAGAFSAGSPAEPVVFSRAGGILTGEITLSIAAPEAAGAVVRYELDPEKVPDGNSPLYSGPLTINTTTTVRARVLAPDRLPGPIASRSFIRVNAGDDALAGFSSDLPIVLIDSFGNRIDSRPSPGARPFQFSYAVVVDTDPATGRAAVTGTPDFEGRGAMHVRGQSSSGFPKKQYAWEIRDEGDRDRPASVLGMPEDSDWILHAPYSDKTLMRNMLVYNSARDIHGNFGGVRARFVEVFFNQNGDDIRMSDYLGVYVLMERISRGEERVDIPKLNELVTDPGKITGGYLFKKDKPPHDRTFRTRTERQVLDFIEPPLPNSAQSDYLSGYMDAFEAALHDDDLRGDPVAGYEAYIDVQSWIDNHLFVETFKEIDGYRISAYYHKPRGGKVFAIPVWDYNLSLGNADYLNGQFPNGWYYPQISKYPSPDSQYPWYPELFKDANWEKRYWDRYYDLRRHVFSKEELMRKIDLYTEELKEAQERNFDKWRVLGTYLWPNASGYRTRTTHQDEVDWMKNWLDRRLDWVDSQWIAPPVMSQDGGNVPVNYALTLSLPVSQTGTIYYTTGGNDPQPSEAGIVTLNTLVTDDAPVSVFVPTDGARAADWNGLDAPANAGDWISNRQGVGFERGDGPFVALSTTNVEEAMYGVNSSIYIRLKFTIATQAQLEQAAALTLRMKYDDGFVAFINGVEVASANAPAPLAWDSKATSSNSDSNAIEWEAFDAGAGLGALRVGENVLAIQGMNTSVTGSDALWIAELEGRFIELPEAGEVHRYSTPVVLSENTVIRARVRNGEAWGALAQGVFIVGAQPASSSNVVVSEINYRPGEPSNEENLAGFTSRGDFEYLVLENISATPVNLSGAGFTDGVTFQFGGDDPDALVLPAFGKGVLVANPAGFAMRYPGIGVPGSGYVLLGTFTGNLNNGGEELLIVDAAGAPIKQFTFDDAEPWPTSADGSGDVLKLLDPASNPDPTKPENWTAGAAFGGIVQPPGGGDRDGDTVPDLIETAMGTDPMDAASLAFPIAATAPFVVDAREDDYFTLAYPRDTASTAVITVEAAQDLGGWQDATAQLVVVSSETVSGTVELVTYRSTVPASALRWNYFRLRVSPQ